MRLFCCSHDRRGHVRSLLLLLRKSPKRQTDRQTVATGGVCWEKPRCSISSIQTTLLLQSGTAGVRNPPQLINHHQYRLSVPTTTKHHNRMEDGQSRKREGVRTLFIWYIEANKSGNESSYVPSGLRLRRTSFYWRYKWMGFLHLRTRWGALRHGCG